MNRQFCTFLLDRFLFGVDVADVQEVVRHLAMTRIPLASPVVGGLINLRGQLVTAIDLRRLLDFPPRPDGQPPMNVVLRAAEGTVSLLVDEIHDVIEIDDSSFEQAPETVQGLARELIRGIYKLQDRLLLDLRTDIILTSERWQSAGTHSQPPHHPASQSLLGQNS